MAKRDCYETLGVSRDAGLDEIKKAYRQKAKELRHNMYRNVKKKESEAEFKRVAEAYEVLSDPDKRAQHDRYGHVGPAQGFTFSDMDYRRVREDYRRFGSGEFEDLFADVFTIFRQGAPWTARRQRRARRGENIEYKLRITLEDAAHGTKMTVTVPWLVACETCSGSGMEPGTSKRTCPTCGGEGQIAYLERSGFLEIPIPQLCPECGGEGEIIEQPCHRCRGTGRVKEKSKISITVPAGVDNGSRLRLKGQGGAGATGGPAGDLYIIIEVIPHPKFQREGQDIHSKVRINYPHATLGTKVKVDTLWGKETVSIPAGTQPGTVIRMRGKGMPNLNGRKGDHFVEVQVIVPTRLSAAQRSALLELQKTFPETEDQS